MILITALALGICIQVEASGKCSDISTEWTLSSTFVDGSSTRIYSDGRSYVDGSTGVSAMIRECSGTYDAVLQLGSGRTFMLNFYGAFLGADSQPPLWANSAFPSGNARNCGGSPCTLLNIRNILDGGAAGLRNGYYILYTRMTSAFVAPDSNDYHLRMENPATANVAPTPNDPSANSPSSNARVIVEHYPAGYVTPTDQEYWLVYPELPTSTGSMSTSPENAVLLSSSGVNYGQFSMPFLITITLK
jgi:hypothetical protein